MSLRRVRISLLIATLLAGVLATFIVGQAESPHIASRWPTLDSTFAVDGWVVGPAHIESANGAEFVTRVLIADTNGRAVTLILSTSTSAKAIYKAAPEVPFLGAGYSVSSLEPEQQSDSAGWNLQVLANGANRFVQASTFGERRGFQGNGLGAWTLVALDTTLGNENDYYLVRLVTRVDDDLAPAARDATTLGSAVFPRVAAWYADSSNR